MDSLTPSERSERMARIGPRGSKPELVVRRLVHGAGYRFRLHDRTLPGTPDLCFASRRKVIFVHGCFWHRHDGCVLARLPKSRLDFWVPKLEGNRTRDIRQRTALTRLGWRSLVVWECQIAEPARLMTRVLRFLGG